jgi:hypothetical protein
MGAVKSYASPLYYLHCPLSPCGDDHPSTVPISLAELPAMLRRVPAIHSDPSPTCHGSLIVHNILFVYGHPDLPADFDKKRWKY